MINEDLPNGPDQNQKFKRGQTSKINQVNFHQEHYQHSTVWRMAKPVFSFI